MQPVSRLSTDIDLDRPGKQLGVLRVPHSRDESAYGVLPVPIAVIANGDGPTVAFFGGHHGDEYEGPIALAELIRTLEPADVRGRVIVMPAANLPALLAGRRLSPVDGGNLSRSYPGSRDGTPTSMIAHWIEAVLLPRCTAAVDLHSGGASLTYLPCALMRRAPDPGRMAARLAALKAFGAPLALISSDLTEDRTLPAAADRVGIPTVAAELAGGARVTPEALAIGRRGIRNLLVHFGLCAGSVPSSETRLMEVRDRSYFVHAPEGGLFEAGVALGDTVKSGAAAGRLHFPAQPLREPLTVSFAQSGLVVCLRALGRAEPGDCLAHVATDWIG